MKTNTFTRSGFNFLVITLFIYCVSGCNSFSEKTIKYVVSHDSIYLYSNGFVTFKPEVSGVTSSGNFAFIVCQQTTHPIGGRDTVSYLVKGKDEFKDSSYYQDRFYLYLNEPITYKQMVNYFKQNNISTRHLNEHLYWMCMLTHSHLKTIKNQFGDIEGYTVETPNGNIIPNEYFRITKNYYSQENEIIFEPKEIEIGRDEIDNNYISFSLAICKQSRFDRPRFPIEAGQKEKSSSGTEGDQPESAKKKRKSTFSVYLPVEHAFNYLTEMKLDNQGFDYLPANGYSIGLLVEVQSRVYFHPNNVKRFNYSAYDIFKVELLN